VFGLLCDVDPRVKPEDDGGVRGNVAFRIKLF
jgi:hypothetical protein